MTSCASNQCVEQKIPSSLFLEMEKTELNEEPKTWKDILIYAITVKKERNLALERIEMIKKYTE